MSTRLLLFVMSLAASTKALGQFQPVAAAASDPFARSAAMARARGRNIHSIQTPLGELEDTCIFHYTINISSSVEKWIDVEQIGAVLSMSAANVAAIRPNATCFRFKSLPTLSQDKAPAQNDVDKLNVTHTYPAGSRTLNFLLGDVRAFALEVDVSCLSLARSCADASAVRRMLDKAAVHQMQERVAANAEKLDGGEQKQASDAKHAADQMALLAWAELFADTNHEDFHIGIFAQGLIPSRLSQMARQLLREHKSNLTGVAGDADAVEWISKSRSSAHSNFAFALLDDLLERSLTESLVSGSTYRSMDVRTPDDEIESSLESGNEQSRHESVGTKRGLVSVMLNETVNVSLCAGCCSEDPLLSFLVSANRQREKNSTTNAFSKPHSKLLVDDSIGATNSSNADDSDVQKSKPLWTKLVANARADRLQPLFKPPALQRCVQTTAEQIEIEGGKTLLSATACACI